MPRTLSLLSDYFIRQSLPPLKKQKKVVDNIIAGHLLEWGLFAFIYFKESIYYNYIIVFSLFNYYVLCLCFLYINEI